MTLGEAADIVYEEAKHQGQPLTRDVCERIAMRLFMPTLYRLIEPGEIARHQRKRYEGSVDDS